MNHATSLAHVRSESSTCKVPIATRQGDSAGGIQPGGPFLWEPLHQVATEFLRTEGDYLAYAGEMSKGPGTRFA